MFDIIDMIGLFINLFVIMVFFIVLGYNAVYQVDVSTGLDEDCSSCKYAKDCSSGMCTCTNRDSFFWNMEIPDTVRCDRYKASV